MPPEKNIGPDFAETLNCPRSIQLETTTRCNLRCAMCAARNVRAKRDDMPEDLYAKIINDLSKHAAEIESLCLFMDGEPLLDKRLPKFIEMAKSAGLRTVSIATNGMFLSPELSDALLESGLDSMIVSIDSLDPGIYSRIRVGGDLRQITENVRRFMNQRMTRGLGHPHVTVRLIEMPENAGERPAFKEYWMKVVDEVVFQPLHHWGQESGGTDTGQTQEMRCNWPFRNMVIYSDGRAGFCCLDYEGIYDLGNFQDQALMEIWHGKAYQDLRSAMARWDVDRLSKCRACDFVSLSPANPNHWKKLLIVNRTRSPIRVFFSFPDGSRAQSAARAVSANQTFCWGIPYSEGIVRLNVVENPSWTREILLERARIYYDIVLG